MRDEQINIIHEIKEIGSDNYRVTVENVALSSDCGKRPIFKN